MIVIDEISTVGSVSAGTGETLIDLLSTQFAGEAWQTGADIVIQLVHTGGSVLTLSVLALSEGLKVWRK